MTSEPEVFTAWITKYALTKGISKIPARLCDARMIAQVNRTTYFHGEGRNWHRTPSSARARAEEMRQAKIKSLRAQIEKLERMEFKEE